MGAVRWSVTSFCRHEQATIPTSGFSSSGSFTSSGTAANITGLTLQANEVLEITTDTAGRINFGGNAATTTTGRPLVAGIVHYYQCGQGDEGAVSVIDG